MYVDCKAGSHCVHQAWVTAHRDGQVEPLQGRWRQTQVETGNFHLPAVRNLRHRRGRFATQNLFTSSSYCSLFQRTTKQTLSCGMDHVLYLPSQAVGKGKQMDTPTPHCFIMKVCRLKCSPKLYHFAVPAAPCFMEGEGHETVLCTRC